VLNSAAVPSANVFDTWASLYASISATAGAALVEIVGVQHMTAGGPYDLDQVEFIAAVPDTGSPGSSSLIIDDGATILPGTIHFNDGLGVSYVGTGPCMSAIGNVVALVDVGRGSTLQASAAGPFLSAPSAGTFAFTLLSNGATLGDGTNAAVTGVAGAFALVQATGRSIIQDGAISGPGAGLRYDDSTQVDLTSLPGIQLQMSSQAQLVAYQPAVPGNWPTPPTQVAQALDELAAEVATATGPWTQVGGIGGVIEAVDPTAGVQAGGGTATADGAAPNFALAAGSSASGGNAACLGGSGNSVAGAASACVGGTGNACGNFSSNAGCFAGSSNQAQGNNTACLGGSGNVANSVADNSVCVGGTGNTALTPQSVCLGGAGNRTIGMQSACVAGQNSQTNGQNAVTLGGSQCTADGDASIAMGYGAFAGRATQHAHASGPNVATTDATSIQTSELVLRLAGATTGTATLTYGDPATSVFPVASSKGYTIEIVATVFDPAGFTIASISDVAQVSVDGAAAVTVVDNPGVPFAKLGNYAATAALSVSSPAPGQIQVNVTLGVGAAAADIVARVKFTETN
jgi:hypothetical protein